jgi:hypothetical protein
MGLIDKLFGGAKDKEGAPAAAPDSTQFHESESTNEGAGTRNSPKREVVQVMLRDTMRKHGIPSDWIECRILSTLTKRRNTGLHVQFVVKQGHDRLLGYVFAFQDSFMREVTRFDSHVNDWLLSVSWRFEGHPQASAMPDPKVWAAAGAAAGVATGVAAAEPVAEEPPPPPVEEETLTGFEPTQDPLEDDDIDRDLQALFAIRDAVLADTRNPAADAPDFEPTRPGTDEDIAPKR